MGSSQNSWILDFALMDDDVEASDFIWATQIIDDQAVGSVGLGLDVPCKEDHFLKNASSKKRDRVESSAGAGSKACREKMRRDKLNDRFLQLCSLLDPGRPPKTDKVAILNDATRFLNQLRVEAEKLKEKNEALQDTIKILKTEKTELRDEKVSLKAEKERMEKMVKGMSVPSSFMSHPATAMAAAFHAMPKTIPYTNYTPMTMWQWMPPASLDTSQDHVLRPPVA